MYSIPTLFRFRRMPFIAAVFILLGSVSSVLAHPLGNFTINHYARIEVGPERVKIRYIVDMAEIPAFQELQAMNSSGKPSDEELNAYLGRSVERYVNGLLLEVDGIRVPLKVDTK